MEKNQQPIKKFSEYSAIIVDDQQSFQRMLKNILADLGFLNVTTLSTAEECKRHCNSNTHNIYLFDYNLGHGENGRQLLIHLHKNKKIPADATVFMVTGDATRPMVLSAIEQEPDDYIIKPISISILQKRLFKDLNQKRALKSLYFARYEKNYDELLKLCLEELSKNTPYNAVVRLMAADALINKGELNQAEIMIEEGLAFENNWEYRQMLGRILSLQGKFEEANIQFDDVIKRRPYNIRAYKMQYDNFLKEKQYDEAERIIERAVDLSPQSSVLIHMQLDLHSIKRNYLKMRDCISSLMELHKFEPEHLSNLVSSFAHTAILFVLDSGDLYHIGMLKKTVNSTIRKYMNYLNTGKFEFDTNVFSEIVDARMDMAIGASAKGKKNLYKAINSLKNDLSTMPNSIFSNIIGGLNQLGEYEYAKSLSNNHVKIEETDINDVLNVCINTFENDPKISDKKRKYDEINREGVTAYKNNDFQLAIKFFDDVLRKAPGNINATINKAQSLYRLSLTPNLKKEIKEGYLKDCQNAIATLDNAPLSDEQISRVTELINQSKTPKK